MDGGKGVKPHVDVHKKLKLESTDVILSSAHAKKFQGIFFYQNFVFGRSIKVEIFRRYKLVIIINY